jgi:YHS domain-containing protein
MVRLQSNTRLLLAAVGIAIVGGSSVNLLGKAAESKPTAATSVASSVASTINSSVENAAGGTHADAEPHSANILSAGDCHIEAQLSKEGRLELFIYGQKERQPYPISTLGLDLPMEAEAVIPGESGTPIPLKAKPYPSEPAGTSSRFVGQFDRRSEQEQVGLNLTIPLDDKTYRVQWRPENLVPGQLAAAPDPAMPQAVTSDTAQRLFLTPGGLYTADDVAANGTATATQKYGSQMSMHNAHPKPGDRICPITDTVANPKFSWIIGGKSYQFCCPPCIEEFVKKAKEKPQSIKAPETYRQPG